MHQMFADWYAKADREPSPQKLESRSSAVESFVDAADVDALLGLLRYLADRSPETEATNTLRDVLKQEDAAFLMRDNDHELRVLAAISLILAISRTSPTSTVVALAVDVASMLGTRAVGPLGPDIVETAQVHLRDEGRRLRVEPERFLARTRKQPTLDAGEFSLPTQGADVPQVQANLTELTKYVVGLNGMIKSLGPHLRALSATRVALAASTTFNAVLAEESSMLWWLIGEHSRDMEEPLSSLASESICLVTGKDLADLTKVTPGPLSVRAIMHKVLDSVACEPMAELTLDQVVDATSRSLRRDWLEGRDLSRLRGLAHCIPALAASIEVGADADWRPLLKSRDGIAPETRLSQLDWARLSYSEWLLLRECEGRDE